MVQNVYRLHGKVRFNEIRESRVGTLFGVIMQYTTEYDIGSEAHNKFKQLAKRKGFAVDDSSREQDMFEHIDLFLTKEDKTYSFDIKAMKKINRYDSSSQDKMIYVEFKNVRGNEGWLYGKAQFIVFETTSTFEIVHRESLAKYCERVVNKRQRVSRASEALYKVYTRDGRKDLISLIELDKIPKEFIHCWKK